MKRFVVERAFWELFPEAKIGVIICNDIDNTPRDTEDYAALLAAAEALVPGHLRDEEFSNNAAVRVWRDAFQKFKTKKGARSSIEALLKRVANGGHIGTINPLVDIYNAISLKYALPCGGEDIETFSGDLRLTVADGSEPFITLGSEESAPPYAGEVVYKDDAGAVCRCWNWRESVRTMLTERTRQAFLCIESVDAGREDSFKSALEELAEGVRERLGGQCRIEVLEAGRPEIIIA